MRRIAGSVLLGFGLLLTAGGCFLFNSPPVAEFAFVLSQRYAPCEVGFDASASHDPDGIIVKYEWNFGDGTSGNDNSVTHTYTASGTFEVTLVVTDNQGTTAAVSQTFALQTPHVPTDPPTDPPQGEYPPGLVRFEGSGYAQSPLPIPGGAGSIYFVEYAGGQMFRVVVLDSWGQRVAQLVTVDGDYEGRVFFSGGGNYQTPFFLDIVAVGPWAITIVGPAQDPPQTYSGCGGWDVGGRLAQYSPIFVLNPGNAAFYYDEPEHVDRYILLDLQRDVEMPLSHEVDVSGGQYVLKIRSGGCWEISVEQRQ